MQDCGWQRRKPLPVARSFGVAGVVNNAIVIATGCNNLFSFAGRGRPLRLPYDANEIDGK
jgi:hypothetical protein